MVKDTLINIESTQKMFEFETKYQTEQQQTQIEMQDIKLQNKENEIKQQWLQKIAILIGFILLAIFFLVYYYLKNKSNKLLKKQNEQLEIISEKMHEVDRMKIDFFTNISHELRTPLTVILGMTEEIEAENEKINPKIKTIKRNSIKLSTLVNQMLDLRKLDDGEMSVTIVQGDITSFISRIIMMLESLALQKGITIKFLHNREKITGCFDPDKLEKIVINLLSNAVKFSKKGSAVTVKLDKDKEQPGFIVLNIEDKGIGIPPEHVEYIFKPFFQASNYNYGSGIGLALTKEMTELMNGTITVNSVENEGTRFTVRLPFEREYFNNLARCREMQITDFSGSSSSYLEMLMEENRWDDETGETQTLVLPDDIDVQSLLIVEDNADLREFVAGIFKKEYKIYTAGNGKKGLDTAMEKMPELIISDVMMPEMDGYELCCRLKSDERTSHIPVILLTAKTGEENVVTGLEQGADDYIIKPFSAKELQARVKNIIRQRQKLREKFGKELDTVEPEAIAVSSYDETFLRRSMVIIEQNMGDPEFSPGVFAKKLGVSRTFVHKKLKSLTGQSASRFIESIRLRTAARLLKERNMNISEIAYQVGFNDPTYFTRQFKKVFNKTPKEYGNS